MQLERPATAPPAATFLCGAERLVGRVPAPLQGARVGLVAHPASLCADGTHLAERIARHPDMTLAALFSPEHGFLGVQAAGDAVPTLEHPRYRIPVHSLYGATREPTKPMMQGLDACIYDLQGIPMRMYTYLATLQAAARACAQYQVPLVVCDRPVVLPSVVDGPMLAPDCRSFVGPIEVPYAYGLTTAEAAQLLRDLDSLDVELHTITMTGYHREVTPGTGWPPWHPPSPEIRSWHAASTYGAVVFAEAFASLSAGRGTAYAYQVLGAEDLDADRATAALQERALPGVAFHADLLPVGEQRRCIPAVRLTVSQPGAFRPATTAVHLLDVLAEQRNMSDRFGDEGSRPAFFDKLFGTAAVREALLAGDGADAIVQAWSPELTRYRQRRERHLLYRPET